MNVLISFSEWTLRVIEIWLSVALLSLVAYAQIWTPFLMSDCLICRAPINALVGKDCDYRHRFERQLGVFL